MSKRTSKAIKAALQLAKKPSLANALTAAVAAAPVARRAMKARNKKRAGSSSQSSRSSISVSMPVAQMNQWCTPVPKVVKTSRGMRVTHSELFVQVSAAGPAYQLRLSEPFTPLDPRMPYLSGIATKFAKFKVHRIDTVFKTSVATTAQGTYYLSSNKDPDAADPVSVQQVMIMSGAVASSAFGSARHRCATEPTREYYTSVSASGGSNAADFRLAYPTKIYVATEGYAVSGTAGFVFVDYDIELFDELAVAIDSTSASFRIPAYLPVGDWLTVATPDFSRNDLAWVREPGQTLRCKAWGKFLLSLDVRFQDDVSVVDSLTPSVFNADGTPKPPLLVPPPVSELSYSAPGAVNANIASFSATFQFAPGDYIVLSPPNPALLARGSLNLDISV